MIKRVQAILNRAAMNNKYGRKILYLWQETKTLIVDTIDYHWETSKGLESLTPTERKHQMWRLHYKCIAKDCIDDNYSFPWMVRDEVLEQSLEDMGYGLINKDYSRPHISQEAIENTITLVARNYMSLERL